MSGAEPELTSQVAVVVCLSGQLLSPGTCCQGVGGGAKGRGGSSRPGFCEKVMLYYIKISPACPHPRPPRLHIKQMDPGPTLRKDSPAFSGRRLACAAVWPDAVALAVAGWVLSLGEALGWAGP